MRMNATFLNIRRFLIVYFHGNVCATDTVDSARPCHCDLSIRQKGESAEDMQFLSFLLVVSLSLLFQLPEMMASDVSACIVDFPNVTRRKEGEKRKKRKADTPFIPRFINFRLFPISPIPQPFIVCGPDENTHAVCVCPILILCPKSSFC